MALMTLLAAAQDGQFFADAAQAVGLGVADCEAAMGQICPAIAAQLKTKAAADGELLDTLLDLLEDNGDGTPLDDPGALTGTEAIADGKAILSDIYGSPKAALAELQPLAGGVPAAKLAKLAAIGATAVLAALAQSNSKALPLTGAQPAVGGERGIFGMVVDSLIKGAVSEVSRQLGPKRRRRSSIRYTTRRRKRSRSTTRRRNTSVLEDIFRDILGAGRR